MRKLGTRHKFWRNRDAVVLCCVDYAKLQSAINCGDLHYTASYDEDDDFHSHDVDILTDLTDHFVHFQALIARKFKPYRKSRRA